MDNLLSIYAYKLYHPFFSYFLVLLFIVFHSKILKSEFASATKAKDSQQCSESRLSLQHRHLLLAVFFQILCSNSSFFLIQHQTFKNNSFIILSCICPVSLQTPLVACSQHLLVRANGWALLSYFSTLPRSCVSPMCAGSSLRTRLYFIQPSKLEPTFWFGSHNNYHFRSLSHCMAFVPSHDVFKKTQTFYSQLSFDSCNSHKFPVVSFVVQLRRLVPKQHVKHYICVHFIFLGSHTARIHTLQWDGLSCG